VKKSFMREKVIHCGKDYLSPEIFPYTGTQQQAVKGKRGKKKKVSDEMEKIGRNAHCWCGSGKKYKKCCGSPEKLAEKSAK